MAKKCLRRAQRSAYFAKLRAMRVPEAVPRDQRQPQSLTCRAQHSPEQVFGVEWGLFVGREDEIVHAGPASACQLRLKHLARRLTHGKVPFAALCLRTAELALRDRLSHLNHAVNQIDGFPSQCEDLAYAHASQHRHKHERSAGIGKGSEQSAYLLRV